MRKLWIQLAVFALCLGLSPTAIAQSLSASGTAQPARASTSTPPSPATTLPQRATRERITAYTLPPERYKKAHDIGRIYFRYLLISFCYGLIVLWLILRLLLGSRYRSWAERVSSRRLVQAVIFSPLLILTIGFLELPTGIYRHWVSSSYGLSIQGWPSWFWDWSKAEFFTVVGGTFFIWLLYTVIRKSPRRWWLYFWLVSLPIGLFLFFLTPLYLDPQFHKFEPLAQKDPALTIALQNLAQRAGENIPPERMFWMGAGEKTTTLNAYVTGFGASKRIVVWDTTIAKLSTPQIVFVAGHEMGHYVLQHIPRGLALGAVLFLVAFYFSFRCVGWVLSHWGSNWGIRALDDWASLPALLLLFSIIAFVSNPLASAVIRYFEHQADRYALEVTHELTPDSGQVAAQAFQVIGDVGLADPDPNPVYVFMFYDHPPIRDRVQFSLSYDPWSQGRQPEFVK
ncbi:MAG TPA: M48 family metallopeptidase [Pyrinomonadaceae bacterium]|nr:M48 family metallopeptidase [Pyrinomonadaceae bacterium]